MNPDHYEKFKAIFFCKTKETFLKRKVFVHISETFCALKMFTPGINAMLKNTAENNNAKNYCLTVR